MKASASTTSGFAASQHRWQSLIVLLGMLCLGYGTWGSFPVIEQDRESRAPLRVVVFDLSAGTTRLRAGHDLWARARLQAEAKRAQQAGEELAVAVYGQEVKRLGIASAEDWLGRLMGRGGEVLRLELDGGGDGASNLDGALALYESELTDPARPGAHLVLCAARDYTGTDPRARLARLARAGVEQTWVLPGDVSRPDFAIEAIRLPEEPALGTPLIAEFDLALSGADRATRGPWTFQLHLQVERQARLDKQTLDVSLPQRSAAQRASGGDVLRWTVRHDLGATSEGRMAVVAHVELGRTDDSVKGDPVPENDTASAQTRAGKSKIVAAVARASERDNLIAWLAGRGHLWPGMQWRILTPNELPEALGELDLIVSFDLGPSELPATLIRAFVQAGGGWFFCGGWGSLRGWFEDGWKASELTQSLPLIPAPQGGSQRDVIFVADGSGSMAGGPFERVRSALAGLVTSAPPEDDLSLRFFTGTLGPSLSLAVGKDGPLAVLRSLMDSRVPGGATSIYYSLERLVIEREQLAAAAKSEDTGDSNAGAREALVFLLTDGKDLDSFDQRKTGPILRKRFEAVGTRLIPIAIGDEPNLGSLQCLLPPGAEVINGNEELDLQEVFLREVFQKRVRVGDLAIVPGVGGKLAGTKDLLAAWNSLGTDLPNLERFLRCESRPTADVLMRSAADGEPVLAWQRVGAGRVAAWASAPRPEWGARYLDGEPWLAPLFRFLASDPRGSERVRLDADDGNLVLTGVPTDWPAEVDLALFAQVPGIGLEHVLSSLNIGRCKLWLRGAGPGVDPLRTRVAPIPQGLSARAQGAPVHGILRDPVGGELLGQVGFAVPCAEEFRYAGRRHVTEDFEAQPSPERLPREPRPDPYAWMWLAAGACLLSLSAVLPGSPLR